MMKNIKKLKGQSEKFIAKARELETEDSSEAFEKIFSKIAKSNSRAVTLKKKSDSETQKSN